MDNKLTRHGKPKIVEVTCPECATLFMRERRKLKKPNGSVCRQCLKKRTCKLAFWPSKRIKEVIANDGRTDIGTDFEDKLNDLKEILWEREQREQERAFEEYNNSLMEEGDK